MQGTDGMALILQGSLCYVYVRSLELELDNADTA